MRIKEKFKQWLDTEPREQIREVQLEVIADEFAIDFYNWMRENDTPINADKYFHYTDEDMLNTFKEEKGW